MPKQLKNAYTPYLKKGIEQNWGCAAVFTDSLTVLLGLNYLATN